jgi:hypothetical protein
MTADALQRSQTPNERDTPPSPAVQRGYVTRDVARRWRVSKDWVDDLIRRGELRAINTARIKSGRPRYVILPEHLAEYERRMEVAPPSKPAPRRRRQQGLIDYYPDTDGGAK